MKRIIALLLALCMVFAMAACSSTPAANDNAETGAETPAEGNTPAEGSTPAGGNNVNACIASEPETIDPTKVASIDGSTYTQHQFENLMKYAQTENTVDESGQLFMDEIVPGQAASYTVSDDQMVYTFTLRDDIFWSDGEPVKAQDFVYGWQRLVDPATAADYGYLLDGIVLNAAAIQSKEKDPSELGIVALDDKTVEITLEAPCAYFLELCAFAALMPLRQDIVEGNDSWTDASTIVVNGPYKVTEWVHDSYIKMEKNEKYYDYANLGPDSITWWLSDSLTAILTAYQTGEYDFIDTFPADMIESLKASGDCFIAPYVGTYYLYLNCDIITDWRVRAAMTLSIDRENIVQNVTQGGQVPATGLVPSGISDSTGADFSTGVSELGALYNTLQGMYPDADLSTYAGRCDLAKTLYDEAVADGAWNPSTTVVYNFNTSDTHKAIAEACASDWSNVLGLNITLANQEWNTYTNGLGEHKFGVARLGWIADYNDPVTYLELFKTGVSYNYGLYSDANYDALIDEMKSVPAGAERDAVMYNAEETLFGEGGFPVAPLYFYTQPYCVKDNIQNVGFTPLGYFFFTYAKVS